jgi:hypothetical protein
MHLLDLCINFRGNYIVNIVRAMGLLITFVTYASSLWNPVLVVMYEVMPSILLQKKALLQLQTEVSRCAFIHQPDIVLKYRQLQILNTMFNNIYARDVFAICLACVLLILVPMGRVVPCPCHRFMCHDMSLCHKCPLFVRH